MWDSEGMWESGGSCLNAVSMVVGSYFSRSGVHNTGTFYDSNKSE